MAQPRKILLADPDMNAVRPLTRVLRQRGYHVQYAPDGAKALELAVLRHPDVILYDQACSFIEAKSFIQILLTNPRTEGIPVVVTAARQGPGEGKARDGALLKPFNLDEVLSRIDHLCRRVEAARELKGDSREIEGGLSQLPLPDLLQILAMNRRSGKLLLSNGADRGELFVVQGRPQQARSGDVDGEKALFRLMSWKDGSFSFAPGPPPAKVTIDRSMEDALLEGMRQADETLRIRALLPPLGHLIELSPQAGPLVDPHPVTAQVLALLEHAKRLADVVDGCPATDLEVLTAVAALIERGVVRASAGPAPAEGPLLSAAELHALRGKLLRGRSVRHALTTKVVLCATGPKGGRLFLGALRGLEPAAREPACLRSSFGTLGALALGDVLRLEFVLVPCAEPARPLWRPFVQGAIGALVLEEGDAVLNLARFCAFDLRLPVVIATHEASLGLVHTGTVPPLLRGAPAGVHTVSSELSVALHTLLIAAIAPPAQTVPESVLTSPRPPPGGAGRSTGA